MINIFDKKAFIKLATLFLELFDIITTIHVLNHMQ